MFNVVDIDECESSPCLNGICQQSLGYYNCTCHSGYFGSRCEEGNTEYVLILDTIT